MLTVLTSPAPQTPVTSVTSIRLTHLLLFHLPSPQLANRHSIKCKPLALHPTRQREHKGGQALLEKDIAQACGTAPQCTASHSGASASSSQILVHTPAHSIRKQSQDPCPSKRALESNSFGPQPRNCFWVTPSFPIWWSCGKLRAKCVTQPQATMHVPVACISTYCPGFWLHWSVYLCALLALIPFSVSLHCLEVASDSFWNQVRQGSSTLRTSPLCCPPHSDSGESGWTSSVYTCHHRWMRCLCAVPTALGCANKLLEQQSLNTYQFISNGLNERHRTVCVLSECQVASFSS